jgi:hypothetical protein
MSDRRWTPPPDADLPFRIIRRITRDYRIPLMKVRSNAVRTACNRSARRPAVRRLEGVRQLDGLQDRMVQQVHGSRRFCPPRRRSRA